MKVQVTVSFPDDLAEMDSEKVEREVFEQVVAEAYKAGKIGPKQIRQLLGFSSRIETDDFLHRSGALEYTVDDLEQDLETSSQIGRK